ncbi:MAG TPA: CorA family divalent cation transporter [Candidatus Paceibacterota bacterium]|nr:CorA family divalent cation transporter [Candidatus Paceibacterota bacterium]
MISRYQYKELVWVDLESPTQEEVRHIMDEFDLPHLVGEELVSNTLRSKVDLYENLLYVILHFPHVTHGVSVEQEVDFVIGEHFLITARYETIDPLHDFSKIFETHSVMDKSKLPGHAGIIFMQMLKELYRHSLHELESITKTLQSIEREIYAGHEARMVRTIAATGKKLLDFKQAIRFHADILHSYEIASKQFFGTEYGYYASAITAEFNKVHSLLEGHRDMLSELQRTNDSLLTSKSNDIMKTFTVMTFVMLPLTLITGIFGMNADFVFIRGLQDFYFVIAAMAITAIIMFIFFRIRKWL